VKPLAALTIALITLASCIPDPACNEPEPSREFFLNADGDDFGGDSVWLCADPFEARPDNYSPFGGDCDDSNDEVHPDAFEMCDGVDNDCDGLIDANAIDAIQWHADDDGDGFGAAINGPVQCEQPAGHVADNTDCDDGSPTISQDCE
jgi:hypothetical protein